MYSIGIDDAGRGPVIGPMVFAGILCDEEQKAKLKLLKVRDSKLLSPKRREFLAREIKKIVTASIVLKIQASEIDSLLLQRINLNKIEAMKIAEIINILSKNITFAEIIIDCPSNNIKSWQTILEKYIKNKEKLKLRCEHKADAHHLIVSAASILAKVTRDSEVEKIKTKLKVDFGSGYPSDPICIKFLKTPQAKELAKQGLVRKSWQTWKREQKKKDQRKLGEF